MRFVPFHKPQRRIQLQGWVQYKVFGQLGRSSIPAVLSKASLALLGSLHAHPLQAPVNCSTTDALRPFRVQCTIALSDKVKAVHHDAMKLSPAHISD